MRQIIYKRDLVRNRVILKPDTWWWRLRYWSNQYGAMITAWLIRPIVWWNSCFWRLNEGEEILSMFDLERMGMRVKEPEPYIITIRFPIWIRKSRKLLVRAFHYFRELE